MSCLNHLVCTGVSNLNAVFSLASQVSNAMTHATESLEYMSRLRDPQVFRFCAIPQVMAIATLTACYDNENVFKKVVKIPRSTRHDELTHCQTSKWLTKPCSARIMVTTRTFADVLVCFRAHVRQLQAKVRLNSGCRCVFAHRCVAFKVRQDDPNAAAMTTTLATVSKALSVRAAAASAASLSRAHWILRATATEIRSRPSAASGQRADVATAPLAAAVFRCSFERAHIRASTTAVRQFCNTAADAGGGGCLSGGVACFYLSIS